MEYTIMWFITLLCTLTQHIKNTIIWFITLAYTLTQHLHNLVYSFYIKNFKRLGITWLLWQKMYYWHSKIKCSITKIYLQLIIHTAIYLRNTYISNTISSRCILITYVDFYVLFQAFPVIPLANFVHSSIDATVASMWRRVNMPQDLVSLFLISHNLLTYLRMWWDIH